MTVLDRSQQRTIESALTAEDILRQRAEEYAAVPDASLDRAIIETVVVLGVGNQKIGIPSSRLDIIDKTPPIAHLPELPAVISGVLQIRGTLLAAVNIARWFDIRDSRDAPMVAVITDPSERKLGLLVDEVHGFRTITEDDLVESFFGRKAQGRHPILGTTRDMITIIDVDKLFDSPDVAIETGVPS